MVNSDAHRCSFLINEGLIMSERNRVSNMCDLLQQVVKSA